MKKKIKNILYLWLQFEDNDEIKVSSGKISTDFLFVKKQIPYALAWYEKYSKSIEEDCEDEEELTMTQGCCNMLSLIPKMTQDQYEKLLNDAEDDDFLCNDIDIAIKLMNERKQKKDKQKNMEFDLWKKGLTKTTHEILKPIIHSQNELAIFGSDLLGYRQVQKYFESKEGGNKITYHFEQTKQILGCDDVGVRVWNSDFEKPSEINANQNKKPSKGCVVDVLQENIRRYYHDEPLIPLYFVMQRVTDEGSFNQQDGEIGENLQNSGFKTSSLCKKNSITGAEMRTVWRLKNELHDEVIAHILSHVTRGLVIESTCDESDFQVLSVKECGSHLLPWEVNKLRWVNRDRKHGLDDSKLSGIKSNDWLWRLLWFKNEMSEKPCQHGKLPQIPVLWNAPLSKTEDLKCIQANQIELPKSLFWS
ncbi:hypothetical protein [Legionella erythra]|uniref:Uncharacterized protein n=1 Tax=Legionella erythra TaxID=448 RepID=A0A0W0TLP0_LEGER|nr:hypothetical protein [Legionella erythra]KTC96443.1 hypothetical protein Lery_1839 [Legionella erythra]